MQESDTAASAGTVTETGSQTATQNTDGGQGAETAGTAEEPMVTIGGKQVPLSLAERALKNDERFTQQSQKLADRERRLAEREAGIQQASLVAEQVSGLARALENPAVLEAVSGVAPDIAQSLPKPQQVVDSRLLAENLQLKFDRFTAQHPEFDEEHQAGIRAEVYRLARVGRLDDALDFDSIGLRLYRDVVIDFETKKRLAEAKKAQQTKADAERAAGTVGAGMPPIPQGTDANKLKGAQLLSLGHGRSGKK